MPTSNSSDAGVRLMEQSGAAAVSRDRASGAGTPFRLQVRSQDGGLRSVELNATDMPDALALAAARGWQVLAVEAPAATPAGRSAGTVRFPLMLFSQELLTLLRAGLNLTEALSTLLAKERQPAVRQVLQAVVRELSEGRNFSDVLARRPEVFPEVYVATVRASERTGDLPAALARFISYETQFEALRKRLVSVAIYPAMLLLVGAFVALFLLGYVVPRFSAAYEASGRELPWASALLLELGRAIHDHYPLVLSALVLMAAGAVWGLGSPVRRRRLLDAALGLPWIAEKAAQFRLARFYRAVGLLLAAGIPLPRAMGMVGGLLSPSQRRALLAARQAVEQGLPLSAALVGQGLAGPVAESLIKVGERSGQMAEMLERTAGFQDDDFARWMEWASRLLEPLLMAVIGIVIGAVVVLMYMPIFDLAGSLQ